MTTPPPALQTEAEPSLNTPWWTNTISRSMSQRSESSRGPSWTRPLDYTDRAVAIDEGFRNIPAPLTFTVTAGHHRDALAAAALLGMEMSRVVVGEVLWEYRRPLIVGDRIRGRRVVAEVRERQGARGGRLRLATLETRYHDQTDTLVLLQREILIETERTDE